MAKHKKCINHCDCCSHYVYDGYETNDRICSVFGYDVPEEYAYEDDDGNCGCTCSEKFLQECIKENNEAWLEDAKGFVEFMEKEAKNNETTSG